MNRCFSRHRLLAGFFLLALAPAIFAATTVGELRCEYQAKPAQARIRESAGMPIFCAIWSAVLKPMP